MSDSTVCKQPIKREVVKMSETKSQLWGTRTFASTSSMFHLRYTKEGHGVTIGERWFCHTPKQRPLDNPPQSEW